MNHGVQSNSDEQPIFNSQSFNGKETISFDGINDGIKLTKKKLLGTNYMLLSLLKLLRSWCILVQYKIGAGGMSLAIYKTNYDIGCVTKILK